MSVIVQDSAGDIWLHCKGADSAVLPLITEGEKQKTIAHVADFSMVRYPVCNNRRIKARAKERKLQKILSLFSAAISKRVFLYMLRNMLLQYFSVVSLQLCFYIAEAIRIRS